MLAGRVVNVAPLARLICGALVSLVILLSSLVALFAINGVPYNLADNVPTMIPTSLDMVLRYAWSSIGLYDITHLEAEPGPSFLFYRELSRPLALIHYAIIGLMILGVAAVIAVSIGDLICPVRMRQCRCCLRVWHNHFRKLCPDCGEQLDGVSVTSKGLSRRALVIAYCACLFVLVVWGVAVIRLSSESEGLTWSSRLVDVFQESIVVYVYRWDRLKQSVQWSLDAVLRDAPIYIASWLLVYAYYVMFLRPLCFMSGANCEVCGYPKSFRRGAVCPECGS